MAWEKIKTSDIPHKMVMMIEPKRVPILAKTGEEPMSDWILDKLYEYFPLLTFSLGYIFALVVVRAAQG